MSNRDGKLKRMFALKSKLVGGKKGSRNNEMRAIKYGVLPAHSRKNEDMVIFSTNTRHQSEHSPKLTVTGLRFETHFLRDF